MPQIAKSLIALDSKHWVSTRGTPLHWIDCVEMTVLGHPWSVEFLSEGQCKFCTRGSKSTRDILGGHWWCDYIHHGKKGVQELTKPSYGSHLVFRALEQSYVRCPKMAMGDELQLAA